MIYRCPDCNSVPGTAKCDAPVHDLYVTAASTVQMWDHWKHLLTPDQREFVQRHMDNLKRAVDAASSRP